LFLYKVLFVKFHYSDIIKCAFCLFQMRNFNEHWHKLWLERKLISFSNYSKRYKIHKHCSDWLVIGNNPSRSFLIQKIIITVLFLVWFFYSFFFFVFLFLFFFLESIEIDCTIDSALYLSMRKCLIKCLIHRYIQCKETRWLRMTTEEH
jgi:hypothetical protein